MAAHTPFRSQVREIVIVVAVLVLLCGGVVAAIMMTAHYTERRDDIPADWAVELGALNPELMPDPVETTDQTCTEDLPCRWAVTSDTAVIMMFDDQRAACRAADRLPGTVRRSWLAVQFTPGALTAQERADLLRHFHIYDRYPDSVIEDLSWLPWVIESCPS